MNKKLKSCLAVILAMVTVFTSIPTGAWAGEKETMTETVTKATDEIPAETDKETEKETSADTKEMKTDTGISAETGTETDEKAESTFENELPGDGSETSESSEKDVSTEAVTEEPLTEEKETSAESECDTENPEKEETAKETGSIAVSIKTPGGKVKVTADHQSYEVAYAEDAAAFVLKEAAETVVHLEVSTDKEGYEIGTYKVTMDSGDVKEEKDFETGTLSYFAELTVKAGETQTVEIDFQRSPDVSAEGDAESESEVETETTNESESETETETETDSENEGETEIAPEDICQYHFYSSGDDTYSVTADGKSGYSAGDLVKVSVTPSSDVYEILSISMREAIYADDDNSTSDEPDELIGFYFEFGEPVPFDVSDVGEDGTIYVEFAMPEADVYMEVTAAEKGSDAGIMLLDVDLEDSLPDGGYFVPGNSTWYAYPSKFADSSYGTSTKQMYIYKDGKKIGTVDGYCIQASLGSPESGNVSMSNKLTEGAEEDLAKALFYLYGGPGWGTTFQGKDGKSYNFSDIFKNVNGLTNGTSFSMSHLVLSKLYWDFCDSQGMSTSWSWNAGWTKGDSGTKKTNVLTDEGKAFVNEIVTAIKQLEFPDCKLSETTFTASDITVNSSTGRYRTPTITYTSIKENTLKIAVSGGMVVVNETSGAETANGTAVVNGGDKFHFELSKQSTSARHATYTGTCTLFGAFRSWRYKHTSAGGQAVGFSYASSDKSFTFDITWPDVPQTTYIEIKKTDGETGAANAAFAGAQYTVYTDSACTSVKEVLTLDANGYAKSGELELGTYYVKETKAPQNYNLDTNVYTLDCTATGGSTVTLQVKDTPYTAVKIKKVSSAPAITMGNAMYSLEGSVFQIASSGDTNFSNVLATLTTDASGDSNSVMLAPGSYIIRETTAPKGYKKLQGTVAFTLTEGESGKTIEIADEPKVGNAGIVIRKDNGSATTVPMADAEFTVKYYDNETATGTPKATWVFKSVLDANGNYSISFSDRRCLVSGTLYQLNGKNVIPLGTLTYEETKAPFGYQINPEIQKVAVSENTANEDTVIYESVFKEKIYFGGVKVQKTSAEQGQTEDGDATFAGTVFEIVNASDYDVVRKDNLQKAYKPGEVVTEIVTDENGIAILDVNDSHALQAGVTYTIREKTAPEGYKNGGYTRNFVVTTSEVIDFTVDPAANPVIRGGFRQEKRDSELDVTGKAQGDATLKGARFELYNSSKSSVVVKGVTYQVNEMIAEFITDENGVMETADDYLPYGTYTLKEVSPPEGYTAKGENLDITFSIREDGKIVDLSKDKAAKNEPIRFDITIIKFKDTLSTEEPDQDMTPLEGVVFDIYLKSTGEKVMSITTDKDGVATTVDKGTYPHGALPYGVYIVKETVHPEDVLPLDDFEVDGTITGNVYDGKEYKGIYKNNIPIEAYIELRKADKETGNSVNVAGAEFQILDSDKNVVEFKVSYPKHEIMTNFKTDESGMVSLPERLPYGTYYLHEVNAPYGYLLGNQDVEFHISTRNSWENVITITYSDDNAMGKLEITKYDSETKDKISGALFHIIADTDVVTGDGTVRYRKGDLVDTVTIDSNGVGTSRELYLGNKEAPAKFYYQEVSAPEGYCLDTERHYFTLEYKDQNTAVVYANENAYNKPTTLNIIKKDIDGNALDGITFEITRCGDPASSGISNTNSVTGGSFTTAGGGKITVKYLVSGTYAIKEMETLPGYVLDDTEKYFVVDTNGFIYESDKAGNNLDGDGAKSDSETITWVNDYTKWDFSKVNVNGDEELPGAEMTITDENGEVVYSWTSGQAPHRINKIPLGKYTLIEITAPEGYVVATKIPFEVTNTGVVQKVTMVDKIVSMSKVNTLGVSLEGARFAVYEVSSADGEMSVSTQPVNEWVTGKTDHNISGLVVGKTYQLRELEAPEGYVVSEPVIFTVVDDGQNQSVTVIDKQVLVSKVNTEVIQIPGAYLEVLDREGNVIDRWISDGTPHAIKGLKAGETYTLIETRAPEGYALASPIEFTVSLDAVNDELNLMNKQVFVHKTEITGGEEIVGAKLSVTDKETGNTADEWVSGKVAHPISNIVVGKTYILHEQITPDGYVTANDIEFTVLDDFKVQHVVMKDDVTKMEITKSDLTTGEPVEGAELIIQDSNGNEVERWVTTDKPYYIEKLPVGTYTLTELTAPGGYVTAETIEFTVADTGEIQKADMKDDVTKLEITKSDLTTGEPVEGAELIIQDSNGNEVERWVTTSDPYYIEKLPVGTYTLTEVTAPDGYVTAETIIFTVSDTGEIQKVDMKDDVTKIEITKSDLTTGKPVEGAELVIRDKDGNEIERWTTTKEPHYIEMLAVGVYTLTEITAPNGYEVAETIEFEVKDTVEIQKVDMKDKPVTPSVSSNVPKTGDMTNLTLYIALALVSAAVVAVVLRRKREIR